MEQPFSQAVKEMADGMGVALFQRFTLSEAALFLRCPIADLENITKKHRIEFIQVTDTQIEFFGFQLVTYLQQSIKGTKPTRQAPESHDRILSADEVQSMTGLSRTSIWRLEGKGQFPSRVPLSANRVGWRLSEVEKWIVER